jgi:hypothetical protein
MHHIFARVEWRIFEENEEDGPAGRDGLTAWVRGIILLTLLSQTKDTLNVAHTKKNCPITTNG